MQGTVIIVATALHSLPDLTHLSCHPSPTPTPPCPCQQLFQDRLGLIIEGEDEMACMVEGCNFLLNAGG